MEYVIFFRQEDAISLSPVPEEHTEFGDVWLMLDVLLLHLIGVSGDDDMEDSVEKGEGDDDKGEVSWLLSGVWC